MKKYIEKLHFITHDHPVHTHAQQVQQVCEAGAKWVQYRCFTKTDDGLLKDIRLIAEICDDWGATLIVTDHIHLKDKADIQGFHIEDMEADFKALRRQLGDSYTLGGSANTIGNLIRLADEGADYAGFGPFAISTTKPNNFPLLGIKDYELAVEKMKSLAVDLPVLAVGGVTLEDIDPLCATGIYGVAVSAAIHQSEDLVLAYSAFYKAVM